jgi:hypothetical protein
MPLLQVLLILVVVGVLLWLVNSLIPMQGTIKSILNAIVVIAVVVWLLNVFGLLHNLSKIRVGSWPNPSRWERKWKLWDGNRRWRETEQKSSNRFSEEEAMLWTIFGILLVLWVLGLITSYTLGGFVHILLVLAVVVLVINLVQGRKAV